MTVAFYNHRMRNIKLEHYIFLFVHGSLSLQNGKIAFGWTQLGIGNRTQVCQLNRSEKGMRSD